MPRYSGVWGLTQQMQANAAGNWPVGAGSQSFTTAGTFTWVAPPGVCSVSVVAVGPGMSCSQAGGGLGWINNYAVVSGSSYSVKVGAAGVSQCHSYFASACTVRGGAGTTGYSAGGTFIGTGGGDGGAGGIMGGGGAGGYNGAGGNGGASQSSGTAGAGGGGGGGGSFYDCACTQAGGGGGGVGLFGQGSNGAGGSCNGNGGGGGSGGVSGTNRSGATGGTGGAYGAGRGNASPGAKGLPSGGAVRIVWPGTTRTFPSTNVGIP